MKEMVPWRIDDGRMKSLETIREKLKIKTLPQLVDMALDEFIAKHQVPPKPEPPQETEKDKSHRKRIAELAYDMRLPETLVRRDIVRLSDEEVYKQYGIDPRALPGLRKYINRTNA